MPPSPTNSPQRGHARLALASRPAAPTGAGRDSHNSVGRHGPITSKLSDELREYLANQPRLVLIGVNGTVRPCEFIDHRPFHFSEVTDA